MRASQASACEAPFYVRNVSSHVNKNATTPLHKSMRRQTPPLPTRDSFSRSPFLCTHGGLTDKFPTPYQFCAWARLLHDNRVGNESLSPPWVKKKCTSAEVVMMSSVVAEVSSHSHYNTVLRNLHGVCIALYTYSWLFIFLTIPLLPPTWFSMTSYRCPRAIIFFKISKSLDKLYQSESKYLRNLFFSFVYENTYPLN